MKLFILLFSFSAFAANYQGTFTAQEVEPILVWEYVSASCARTEYQTCNCDDQGCQTCSYDVYYECGSDQWVRKGSKPIYNLEVEYDINLKGEPVDLKPALANIKEIDKDYKAESLLTIFFARPVSKMLVYAQNATMDVLTSEESSVGPGKKRIKLTAEWLIIDSNKIDKIFKQTIIVNKKEIHFSEELTKLPLALTICAGQDRRLSRNVKPIGCQEISTAELKAGTVILKKIDFTQINRNRDLVYFFNWRVLGTWLTGNQGPAPFKVIERK